MNSCPSKSTSDSNCSICGKNAMAKCQKCLSIVYCNKTCQRAGWKKHKRICASIEKKREAFNDETSKLESKSGFKTAVGSFHKLEDTKAYCQYRLELALALQECGAENQSLLALELGVNHLLYLLKLTGAQGLLAHEVCCTVPSMLIQLGNEQKAYDFLWWWKQKQINDDVKSKNKVVDLGSVYDLKLDTQNIEANLPWDTFHIEELLNLAVIKIKAQEAVKSKLLEDQVLEICEALKMKNSIVWKFLIDYRLMDELCRKELLVFKSFIDSHPQCDLNKAVKLMKNCSYSWRASDFVQKYIREKVGTREMLIESSQYGNCADLSGKRKYAWFIDCYRLRVDDDYAWGGCYLHGVYDQDNASPKNIAKDFMIYCNLAAKKGYIPCMWDWSQLYDEASKKICYACEKSDIQEDWDSFTPMMMRMTAEGIYGGRAGSFGSKHDKAWKKFNVKKDETFKDVGGVHNWRMLVRKLKCEQSPNFNHGYY